jgi:hypothetical protein
MGGIDFLKFSNANYNSVTNWSVENENNLENNIE